MFLIIEHAGSTITNVLLLDVVAQQTLEVITGYDSARVEEFMRRHAGETVTRGEYEEAVGVRVWRRLMLGSNGSVYQFDPNVFVVESNLLSVGLLMDLMVRWQEGKYLLVADEIVENPAYRDLNIVIPPLAEGGRTEQQFSVAHSATGADQQL